MLPGLGNAGQMEWGRAGPTSACLSPLSLAWPACNGASSSGSAAQLRPERPGRPHGQGSCPTCWEGGDASWGTGSASTVLWGSTLGARAGRSRLCSASRGVLGLLGVVTGAEAAGLSLSRSPLSPWSAAVDVRMSSSASPSSPPATQRGPVWLLCLNTGDSSRGAQRTTQALFAG